MGHFIIIYKTKYEIIEIGTLKTIKQTQQNLRFKNDCAYAGHILFYRLYVNENAVRKTKIRLYAVRKLKIKQYARGWGFHPNL